MSLDDSIRFSSFLIYNVQARSGPFGRPTQFKTILDASLSSLGLGLV